MKFRRKEPGDFFSKQLFLVIVLVSTGTALPQPTPTFYDEIIVQGSVVITAYLNFKMVFDAISHKTAVDKLLAYGLDEYTVCLNIRNRFFTVRVTEPCQRVPKEVVESLTLDLLRSTQSWTTCSMLLYFSRGAEPDDLQVFFNHSMILIYQINISPQR